MKKTIIKILLIITKQTINLNEITSRLNNDLKIDISKRHEINKAISNIIKIITSIIMLIKLYPPSTLTL